MELLQIRHISFTYPEQQTPALQDINLTVRRGEFAVMCGASGCGKTTLLRLCKPAIAPHGTRTGDILYNGLSLDDADPQTKACAIGYVGQNPEQQIVTDKVWHELAFGLENMGLPNDVIRRRVSEMAQFLGIQNWFHKNTDQLSGGQKQLLNLASVMVMQPELLILDEPTSQLDPIGAADFIGTLKKLNRDLGLTILLVEHRLEEVIPAADKVILMENGTVLCCDTPGGLGEYLYTNLPEHPLIDSLPSAMRIYHGLKDLSHADTVPLTVRDGRQYLENALGRQQLPENAPADTGKTPGISDKKAPVLELKNVWYRFELVGGNGSGKTTLLNVMCGIYPAYSGSVSYLGKPLRSYKGTLLYRNNMTMLPQDPQLMFVEDSIREDYEATCRVMGRSREETEQEILHMGELLSIAHLLDRHPYDVSGGELQKAALGKLLLLRPRVIFMDEPTKGLDGHSKKILAGQLRQLTAQDITIVMVTHDIEFAAQYGDLCGMLFDGQIISQSPPEDFFSGNSFYTTAANRIGRRYVPRAITCRQVVEQVTAGMSLEEPI